MWKKIRLYLACFLLGFGIAISAIFVYANSAGKDLERSLASARSSLAKSIADNAVATATVQRLSGQLDSANKLTLGQQSELAKDKQRLASQQQELDLQKSIIDGIASTISSGSKSIGDELQSLASGFSQLYDLYHPGTNASKSP